jgi:signal transduction histidine kinase
VSKSTPSPRQAPAEATTSVHADRAALMNVFARTIGHELRNRLNAARLTFSVVRLCDDERRAEALGALDESLKQLEESVAFASSIAVAQARVIPAEPGLLPLAETLAEVRADHAELALQPAVELRVVGSTSALDLDVDAMTFRLALINLIASAVKRADRGRGERWVEIRVGADTERDEWRVDVEDNGVGLAGVERAVAADPRTAAPTGQPQIEIVLARETIERRGGRLWVESNRPGRGTILSFTLNSGISPRQPSGIS